MQAQSSNMGSSLRVLTTGMRMPLWSKCGIGVVVVLGVVLGRGLLVPWMGLEARYFPVYPVMILLMLLLGAVPGLVSALAGVLATELCLVVPFGGVSWSGPGLARMLCVYCSAIALGYLCLALWQTKKKLNSNLAYYETLFQSIGEGVAVYTQVADAERCTFRFIGVNDAMCRMLGYDWGEMSLLDPVETVIPDRLLTVLQGRVSLSPDDTILYERILRTKDGREIPAEVRTRVIPHEGKQMMLSVIRDITERKQLQALRQAATGAP